MQTFYQQDYKQAGLTTDLPDARALKHLLATGFKDSKKDFSRVLALFNAIGISQGARVLDFGANWGYGVWQFRQAGYEAMGYELSKPRADFARELDVTVLTDWREVVDSGLFDVAFSSHVLEHTPDPAQAIQDQYAILKPDGYLIALFPNGSEAFRAAQPDVFHRLWGRVHPVMLNDGFISAAIESHSVFQGSLCDEDLDKLSRWDQRTHEQGDLAASELLIVARRSADQQQSAQAPPTGERGSA